MQLKQWVRWMALNLINYDITIQKQEEIPMIEPGPNNVNTINKGESLKWLEGDEKMLKRIRAIFVKNVPGQIEKLKEAVRENDVVLVERLAHSIKGSASMIGALLLRDEAYKIELSIKDKDMKKTGLLCEGLAMEGERVLKALKETNEA